MGIVRKRMILVFAGPSGSGKTTITDAHKKKRQLIGRYINTDQIQHEQNITHENASSIAEALRQKYIVQGKSFTFETIPSKENIQELEYAKSLGYFIRTHYIFTRNPLLNIARVEQRVREGGHRVPPDVIRATYEKSLKLLPELYRVSDECYIYDNTGEIPIMIYSDSPIPNNHWNKSTITKLIDSGSSAG